MAEKQVLKNCSRMFEFQTTFKQIMAFQMLEMVVSKPGLNKGQKFVETINLYTLKDLDELIGLLNGSRNELQRIFRE